MCDPISLSVLAGAAVSAGAAAYSGSKQASATKKATEQATQNAQVAATQQEEQINRQNAKAPDVSAIDSANQQAAAGGAGSTLLTGPGGVDPTSLTLGSAAKNNLLGQ